MRWSDMGERGWKASSSILPGLPVLLFYQQHSTEMGTPSVKLSASSVLGGCGRDDSHVQSQQMEPAGPDFDNTQTDRPPGCRSKQENLHCRKSNKLGLAVLCDERVSRLRSLSSPKPQNDPQSGVWTSNRMAAKQEMSPKLWFLEAVYSGLARLDSRRLPLSLLFSRRRWPGSLGWAGALGETLLNTPLG